MNLRKEDLPSQPQENLQEKPNLKRQASRNYQNYEGNIEANGYDFQRLEKMQAESMNEINPFLHKHHQVHCL